jgi:hypothetical protein
MIYERNTLNYEWIDRTSIFGAIFYFIDTMNVNMENREMNIVISLSIVLLILVIDKRQDRYINGIFTQQHKINW